MKFSLILSTVGRRSDLDRFFEGTARQVYRNFEVIVVGPPDDTGVREYLRDCSVDNLIYAGPVRGHSRALNVGLERASGDVVAFPDDDCWYPDSLLQSVRDYLVQNSSLSAVCGRSLTAEGLPSSGRWDLTPGRIKRSNVWTRSCSISIFARIECARALGFDETLGVGAGTPWGGGEDPDFILRLIESGRLAHYEPDLIVHHPEWTAGPASQAVRQKARAYGRGFGRVLRKHRFPLGLVAPHLVRPLGGTCLNMALLRFRKAGYHFAVFSGRTAGWLRSYDNQTAEPAKVMAIEPSRASSPDRAV